MSKKNNTKNGLPFYAQYRGNILEEKQVQQLISEVKYLIETLKIDTSVQLVFEKIPEMSNKTNLLTAHLNISEKELNRADTSVSQLSLLLEKAHDKREKLLNEVNGLRAGDFDCLDLESLPSTLTLESLKQPENLTAYLAPKEKMITQVEADLQLLQRNLENSLILQDAALTRICDLREALISLSAAAQELVKLLQQVRDDLEGGQSVQNEAENDFLVQKIDKILRRIDSFELEADEHKKEPESVQTASPIPSMPTPVEAKPSHVKFDHLTRKDNSELENLLANGEYERWEAEFTALAAKYHVAEICQSNEASAISRQTQLKRIPEKKFMKDNEFLTYIKPQSFLTKTNVMEDAESSEDAERSEPAKFDLSREYLVYRPSEKAQQKSVNKHFDPLVTDDN
ncbi:hypothetical protein [Lactovum odontotermitis]